MAPTKSQKTGSDLIWFKTLNNLYLFQREGHSVKSKKKLTQLLSYSLFQSLPKQVQFVDNLITKMVLVDNKYHFRKYFTMLNK